MSYYPVFLNLKGCGVLVVGGGAVARQKLPALLEAGADVHVVAPDADPGVEQLARDQKIRWSRRGYETPDLGQAALVIAATDDPALQQRVASEARARGLWVNVVDVTPLCDFITPAVVTQGGLQIAISTGGVAPALAKFLRKKLAPQIGGEYAQLVALAEKYRPEILKLPKDRRQALWDSLASDDFLNRIKTDGLSAAEDELKGWIHGKLAL